MSKAIQFMILSLLLCLSAIVFAQDVQLNAITPTTLTVTGGANSRECPQTSCAVVMKLPRGTVVTADATAVGQAVSKKNNLWYHITLSDGRQAFVYSGTVTISAAPVVVVSDPAVPAVVVEQSAAVVEQPAATGNTVRPANCTEARAMGLTAEQAAQWSHLDRDKDGVACYGD
jgi:hypothetical protein